MEVIQKKSINTMGVRLVRSFVLLFLFLFTSAQILRAQTDSVITDSGTSSAVEDSGPSISNISKNLTSSAAELEKIRNEEILSYIYMGVGFSIVIGIAWFTTVLARKRKRKEDEVRAIRAQNIKHKAHHHGHGHRR